MSLPLSNDAIVFGLIMAMVAFVFWSSGLQSRFWKRFYMFIPSVLACYLLPSIANSLGLISGADSNLYFVASRYLLPASLILLCLSIDLEGIRRLGSKAIIMFLTATMGIVLGGPLALLLVLWIAPDLLNGTPLDMANGLATVAGSWIGGGANQAAMKEIYKVGDDVFASMLVVDITVGNIWMAFLLYGANISQRVDAWFQADTSAIEDLRERVEAYQASVMRIPTTRDTFMVLGIAMAGTGLAHLGADLIAPALQPFKATFENLRLNSLLSGFFWLVILATTIGVGLSFTRARRLEGVGASRFGSVFIYILVATIGMKMDIGDIFNNLGLFAVGILWMLFHVSLLLIVGKRIKAPFFFVAVGSQANVGGAASAPVVAAAFSPALAPVGVLMAVLGYALGTYGAIVCAELMRFIAS